MTISRAKFTGLQINMQGLQTVTVSEDKPYATVQGGAYGQAFIDTLWEQDLIASKWTANLLLIPECVHTFRRASS